MVLVMVAVMVVMVIVVVVAERLWCGRDGNNGGDNDSGSVEG